MNETTVSPDLSMSKLVLIDDAWAGMPNYLAIPLGARIMAVMIMHGAFRAPKEISLLQAGSVKPLEAAAQ